MKVIDIINDLISTKTPTGRNLGELLQSKDGKLSITPINELRPFKDKLMECDEFKECELLEFMPMPIVQNKEGKAITAVSLLLGEGMKLKGRCFLLSLALTPTIYDPKTMYDPVKDGVTLTPVMYDQTNFTPYRKIVLPWCMEGQDVDLPLRRAELLVLIDKILKNPEEYSTKGFRRVMARGIFESIVTEDTQTGSKENLDIDMAEPPLYSQIFYLHQENIEGKNEVTMDVKSKVMHNSLKEKFLKRFEGKQIILEEELNKFLEENGGETDGN